MMNEVLMKYRPLSAFKLIVSLSRREGKAHLHLPLRLSPHRLSPRPPASKTLSSRGRWSQRVRKKSKLCCQDERKSCNQKSVVEAGGGSVVPCQQPSTTACCNKNTLTSGFGFCVLAASRSRERKRRSFASQEARQKMCSHLAPYLIIGLVFNLTTAF